MDTPNGPIRIASDAVEFKLDNGQTFTLKAREFLHELNDLWKAAVDAKATERDYLRAVAARVAELNPGIVLDLGETDALVVEVGNIVAKKKQMQAEHTNKLLNSAFSMGSTPETSRPTQ